METTTRQRTCVTLGSIMQTLIRTCKRTHIFHNFSVPNFTPTAVIIFIRARHVNEYIFKQFYRQSRGVSLAEWIDICQMRTENFKISAKTFQFKSEVSLDKFCNTDWTCESVGREFRVISAHTPQHTIHVTRREQLKLFHTRLPCNRAQKNVEFFLSFFWVGTDAMKSALKLTLNRDLRVCNYSCFLMISVLSSAIVWTFCFVRASARFFTPELMFDVQTLRKSHG